MITFFLEVNFRDCWSNKVQTDHCDGKYKKATNTVKNCISNKKLLLPRSQRLYHLHVCQFKLLQLP